MSEKITLEDWNTMLFLTKNLYLPIEFNIEEGEHDLYSFTPLRPASDVYLKFNINHDWHFYDNDTDEELQLLGGSIVKRDNGYHAPIISSTNFRFKGYLDVIDDWRFSYASDETITPLIKMFGYYFEGNIPNFYFEKHNYNFNFIHGDFGEEFPRSYDILEDDVGTYVDGEILTAKRITSNMSFSQYIYPNMRRAYEPPVISVNEPLYIGNNNVLSDKLSLSADVEYSVYYHNKIVTEIKIDEDFNQNEIKLKVVTKSDYPYLPSEQLIIIPVVYKEYEQVSDFENYDFIKLENMIDIGNNELIFNNNVTIYSETGFGHIQSHNGSITINDGANVTLKNMHFLWVNVFNKGVLTVEDGGFGSVGSEMIIVNDGTFIANNDCAFSQEITIINNDNIIIRNCKISMTAKTSDLPFIHNAGAYEIINNRVTFDGRYDGFNITFIRTNDIDAMQMQKDNNFNYDGRLTLDGATYLVKGKGFAYALIDDDTIRFNNLEVSEE